MAIVKPVAPHRKQKRKQSANRPPHVAEDVQIIERRAKALQLRRAGAHYRVIAQQCGVSVEVAYADVQAELAALRKVTEQDAEVIRDLELRRLDDYMLALAPKAQRGDVQAITACLRVQERRAKYLGLDAATKQEIIGDLPAFVIQVEGSDDEDVH